MSNGNRPLIVVPSDDPAQCQGSPRMAELEAVADLKIFPTRADSFDEQIERAQGATVIINSRSYLEWREDAFNLLPDLRFISVCGIGTDSIDLDAARDHGITVSNIPGKTAPVVAEHAFGLMFAAAKRAAWYTEMTRKGEWVKQDGVFLGDKTVGIVGTGNIGAEMARLCNAFGMNVIAYTFNPSDERAKKLGVRFVELDELLALSDVITIHTKLTPDSEKLIGAREISLMKPTALLVNVARGPIVDEAALVEALNAGDLSGAALDVFEDEPLPEGSPITQCEQVVLTPHIADMTPEGLDLLNQGVVENSLAYLNGTPQNVVN
ncbi:MAG: glycerate dehydrogenase [Chloroflexi bacterium]|nr:glycerate dehydrogenase [Chloroflexota bacterium]